MSLNAISRASKLSTMQLKTWIGKHKVSLLVDSGLTYNFVNVDILRKLGLRGEAMEPFEVKVTNEDKLNCEQLT